MPSSTIGSRLQGVDTPASRVADFDQGLSRQFSIGEAGFAKSVATVGNSSSPLMRQNSFTGASGLQGGEPAPQMQNGPYSAASTSRSVAVTAPNASTEEIEMSMKAFARELIGEVGGERALNANRQLTSLLNGTEAHSATQKYLRKFVYAVHLLNVPQMYARSDAQHAARRLDVANALIDVIDIAAARHEARPGNADEVFSAKLDLGSSTGKASYKAISTAWQTLNTALAHRSVDSTDMQHMQAYYDLHVVPRTQLRAQFVYGQTTDNAEALLCSGSKQAVWDATRQLLCSQGANPEEKGLNLACATELLHQMPEFLRRPADKAADAPEKKTDTRAPQAPSDSRDGRTDGSTPQAMPTFNATSAGTGAPASGTRGAEHWNANINGDQIMMGPTINVGLGAGGADGGGGYPRARRHSSASSAPASTVWPNSEPRMQGDVAPVSEGPHETRARSLTASGISSATLDAGTAEREAETLSNGYPQNGGNAEMSLRAVQLSETAQSLRTSVAEPSTVVGAGDGRHSAFPAFAGDSDRQQVNHSGASSERSSRSGSFGSNQSLLRTFSPPDPTRRELEGLQRRSKSGSTSSGAGVDSRSGTRSTSLSRNGSSPVPPSPHYDVPMPPPVILTTGLGQRAPAESIKQWQATIIQANSKRVASGKE